MSLSRKEAKASLNQSEGSIAQPTSSQPLLAKEPSSKIKNVWKYNVEQEFAKISKLLDEGFTYVAMDTEFPGILFNIQMEKTSDSGYRMLKQNVDLLKLIQMGITLSNEKGEKPKDVHTWQFNLNFSVPNDKHNPDSINLLKEAGINFEEMSEHGIDHMVFSDLLMSSGLVVNDDITWITFHGTYDFAYVMKVLINDALPATPEEFGKFMKHCFPCIYDIKTIINDIDDWKNLSLSKLAQELHLKRHGIMHQAGSDALLTCDIFFSILSSNFPNGIPQKYFNKVFTLNTDGSYANYTSDVMIHSFASIPYHYPTQYPGYYMPDNYYMENYYQNQARVDQRHYYNEQRQVGMPYVPMNRM